MAELNSNKYYNNSKALLVDARKALEKAKALETKQLQNGAKWQKDGKTKSLKK